MEHRFSLVLERRDGAEEVAAQGVVGDAVVSEREGVTVAEFQRSATAFADAVLDAFRAVEGSPYRVEMGRWPLLHNRDYMLLWGGEVLSELGSQSSAVAYPLLILALTGSAAKAGVVGLAKWLPLAVCAIPASALADRVNRKRLMIACDAIRLLGAGSIVAMLAISRPSYLQIIAVAFIDGALFTTSYICERGALRHVVPAEQVQNAIAQNKGGPPDPQATPLRRHPPPHDPRPGPRFPPSPSSLHNRARRPGSQGNGPSGPSEASRTAASLTAPAKRANLTATRGWSKAPPEDSRAASEAMSTFIGRSAALPPPRLRLAPAHLNAWLAVASGFTP